MAFLVPNGYTGLCVESSRGVLNTGGAAVYIPVTAPQVTPQQKFLRDEALRGSPVMVYDQVQGVRNDEYEFKTYLYADTFPNVMKALLGGTDTVTGSTIFTHTMKLLNSATTGSQPASYSLLDFDGANYFTMLGGQAASCNITGGVDAAADATVKWIANGYTSATSGAAPFTSLSVSTEHLIPTWDATISVNAVSLTYISSFELNIDRKTQPIFTLGTQAPHVNFAGPIEVSGKFTAVVDTNADPFSTGTGFALGRSPEATVITLTSPNDITTATNHSLAFTMTSTQFQNVKRTKGKEYLELEVEFTANADATDATTGYSPLAFVALNAQSTAY